MASERPVSGAWNWVRGVFGVRNQPSGATLSKLKHISKQAGGGCACELGAVSVEGLKLRPLMVITPSFLLPLLLQVSQLWFVHRLLHQVLLPPHAIAETLGHVWDEVRYEGLDAVHQVLREALISYELPSTDLTSFSCQYVLHSSISMTRITPKEGLLCSLFYRCMFCQFSWLYKSLHKAVLLEEHLDNYSRKEERNMVPIFSGTTMPFGIYFCGFSSEIPQNRITAFNVLKLGLWGLYKDRT